MKKICLLLLSTLIFATTSKGEEEKYAEIQFDTLTISLGTFSEKDALRTCSFTFKNVGTAPLIIHQAFASCGCTTPDFPKTPIKPGETGSIGVTYNGEGRPYGRFTKKIIIRCNGTTEVVRLTIEGEMKE